MMSRPLSKVLRIAEAGAFRSLQFRCPGCKVTHQVGIARPDDLNVWTWDGNVDAPSIEPGITNRGEGEYVCTVHVDQGRLHYMDDCTHEHRGFVMPMEVFKHPEDLPPLPKQDPPRLRKPRWRAL